MCCRESCTVVTGSGNPCTYEVVKPDNLGLTGRDLQRNQRKARGAKELSGIGGRLRRGDNEADELSLSGNAMGAAGRKRAVRDSNGKKRSYR